MLTEVELSNQSLQVTVTLVHGTWARNSKWPRLEQELLRQFGLDNTLITYLPWTGGNTASARLSAAALLQSHLRSLADQRPTAKHFVVAHSHGGNIALLAMRDNQIKAALSGLVCLSTPFLLYRPLTLVPDEDLFNKAAYWGIIISVATISGLAAYLSGNGWSLLPIPVTLLVLNRLLRRWRSSARTFLDRVSPPPLDGVRLLIVRSPSDETSLSLGALQAITRLLSALWSFVCLGWVDHGVDLFRHIVANRFIGPVVSVVAAGVFLWFMSGYFYFIGSYFAHHPVDFNNRFELILLSPALLFVATAVSSYFTAILLVGPLLLFTSMLLIPFGPGFALHAPFLEISVEPVPENVACEVVQLGWGQRDFNPKTRGLQHSRTHDDPRAIAAAISWLQARTVASKP